MESEILSEGNQEDWVTRLRNLTAAKAQLETAMVDPNFWGKVKDDRIKFYESEVMKWEALCKR